MFEKICAQRLRNLRFVMASTSSDESDEYSSAEAELQRVRHLSDDSLIDLRGALDGYIDVMKKKKTVNRKVMRGLDAYVKLLEREYKCIFNVTQMNYDLTDSEVEYDESPPHRKIARLSEVVDCEGTASTSNEVPAAVEKYYNELKTKIKRLIFDVNPAGHSLCNNDMQRKLKLREFIVRSNLKASEIQQAIQVPAVVNPIDVNPEVVNPPVVNLPIVNPPNPDVDPNTE